MQDKSCTFCKIIKGEISLEKIGESDKFIAIKDANPRVEGHSLIIPKNHYVTLLDIPNTWGEELLSFTKKIAGKIMDETGADGFNIVMNNLEAAGQVVGHAHLHIFPRKDGDGKKLDLD